MQPALVIAAHPDDETLGAAVWMSRWRGPIHLLMATDGSPRVLSDALRAGYNSREAYRDARRTELFHALSFIGISREQCTCLEFPDQELIRHLDDFVSALDRVIREVQPGVVLAPPYEGGHPDHDTCALAAAMLRERHSFRHREYRMYHASADGELEARRFLPPYADEVLDFTDEEFAKKRLMLGVYRSQEQTLAQFVDRDERFRDAPAYDFSKPPHEGQLLYERWGLGMTGEQWRAQACALMAH